MPLSFPTSETRPLVGRGHALLGVFDPACATCGGAGAYCKPEGGSPRTPAGHGPAPQALQVSILGKLGDIGMPSCPTT
jgi:hypothetical protein